MSVQTTFILTNVTSSHIRALAAVILQRLKVLLALTSSEGCASESLKGEVHPRVNIRYQLTFKLIKSVRLSFVVHETFLELNSKLVFGLNSWGRWGLVLNIEEKQLKKTQNGSIQLTCNAVYCLSRWTTWRRLWRRPTPSWRRTRPTPTWPRTWTTTRRCSTWRNISSTTRSSRTKFVDKPPSSWSRSANRMCAEL